MDNLKLYEKIYKECNTSEIEQLFEKILRETEGVSAVTAVANIPNMAGLKNDLQNRNGSNQNGKGQPKEEEKPDRFSYPDQSDDNSKDYHAGDNVRITI